MTSRPALLALDPVVHHARLERAGTIERVQRDQVVEPLGLGLAQQLAHPRALELEDAEGGAFAEHLVGLRVVERDGVDVEIDAFGALDLRRAQSSMSVSVLSPRKSIFRRPTRSTSFMFHCVVISSRAPL